MKHDWVLCKTEKPSEKKTAGGLVLSPAHSPTKVSEVVKAGPDSDCKAKDKILHPAGAGVQYEIDGKLFLLLRDLPSEIYGVV